MLCFGPLTPFVVHRVHNASLSDARYQTVPRASLLRKLARQFVVFRVIPYPEPNGAIGAICPKRAIAPANSDRMQIPDFLEVEGWMPWVRLQEFEVLSCQRLNCLWQRMEAPPEFRRGVMRQSARVFPFL